MYTIARTQLQFSLGLQREMGMRQNASRHSSLCCRHVKWHHIITALHWMTYSNSTLVFHPQITFLQVDSQNISYAYALFNFWCLTLSLPSWAVIGIRSIPLPRSLRTVIKLFPYKLQIAHNMASDLTFYNMRHDSRIGLKPNAYQRYGNVKENSVAY